MGIDELLKFALSGENAILFSMLGVIAFFCTRVVRVSNTWAYSVTATIGGVLGAMSSFGEAMESGGINPVLMTRAAMVGMVVSAGGTILVGTTLHKALQATFWPVSPEKQLAEAVRDPLSLATAKDLPAGVVTSASPPSERET
jgi:hypothetical protein